MNIDKRALKGIVDKTKPTNVAMDRVKSYVDRLEKMEEERKAIGGDIRDIYLEAKGNGFDVKTLRWLVSERKVDAAERDERDALRAVYANALGMAVDLVEVNGLSLRQASKRTGIPKSNIHRALAVPKVSQPAPSHDPETGEITTARLDTPPGGSGDLIEGHSATPASDATGNSAHKGEENGSNSNGEGRSSEGLQPERQSGRGRDQGGDGGARHENGKYPRPQQRDGGPRGGGGDHQSPNGQYVVRLGGDEGSLAASRGVDAPSTPPLGAVAEAQPERVARQDDGLDIPPRLDRRQRASA